MGIALVDRTPSAARPTTDDRESAPAGSGASLGRSASSARSTDSRSRVIAATLRCVARFGLAKTTVDDIAREARISRATVYRVFPGGRDEIVDAAVSTEIAAFFGELADRLSESGTIEDRLVAAMTSATDQLARHEALAFVLAHEPGLVLPAVSFGGLDNVLDVAGSFVAPYLADWLEPEDARRVGEWVTRLVLSHVVCPHPRGAVLTIEQAATAAASGSAADTVFAIHPEALGTDRARRLVRQFVLPGLEVLLSARSASALASVPST